ncbi:hypothetical protein [Rhizobium sp. LjRoot254]|uniref:hypothetical protein n=1 Tax=Rhizobium sp. LjRoot254 TaxID=3342297 RepID=UPI003ED088FF
MKHSLQHQIRLGAFAALAMGLSACSPERPPPYTDAEIEFLATDAHVIVGGVALTAPYVALSDFVGQKQTFSFDKQGDRKRAKERLEEFRKLADHAETAPVLDKLEIGIGTYGWDDFRPGKIGLCARLSRQWSKSLCDDPWAPLERALPGSFYLVDAGRFDAFKSHFTVNFERKSDQLGQMHLERGKPSLVCDKKPSSTTTFCTAALLLDEHLVAVWTAFGTARETSKQRSDREGRAIAEFVSKALRDRENFSSLFAAACSLRDPLKSTGLRGDPCAKTSGR